MTNRFLALLSTTAAAVLIAGAAFADDTDDQAAAPAPAPAAASAPAAPAAPASWFSTIKYSGHVEFGATMNPAAPTNGVNFGHLFTDKANQVVLNQFALTAQRDPDTSTKTVDFGFKIQGMYGLDSQFTHFLGEFDRNGNTRNAFDLVEANVLAHVNAFTKGGIDVKVGQFSTPLGNEVIDPTGNFFYSKSYIFNFGIPLKHTGILVTTHVNSTLDVYTGYTTGVNTSLGSGGGDNDGQFHFLGGIGLNFKNVTIIALTHIGPEIPYSLLPETDVHSKYRYLSDAVITWHVNSKLTSITELNYIKDDGFAVDGGGVAEYLTYPLSPTITAGIRGEIWRDSQGFWVYAFPGNRDFISAEKGVPNGSYGPGVPTTYSEITVGLNIKPAHLPKIIDGLVVRPELRYDTTLAGGTPFGGIPGTGRDQVTIALDVVAPLSF